LDAARNIVFVGIVVIPKNNDLFFLGSNRRSWFLVRIFDIPKNYYMYISCF